MLLDFKLFSISDKLYLPLATLFLFLLGSQLLVNHWLPFIFLSLFLIDRKKIFTPEAGVLLLFIFALYGGMIYRDFDTLSGAGSMTAVLQEAIMVFVVYMVGASLRGLAPGDLLDERRLLYLLYAFFFAYNLAILYSYFALPQDNPLKTWGMQVYYKRDGEFIHEGKLLSSIIAYFLSTTAVILPLLIFNFKAFLERRFTAFELLMIGAFGTFSLYLATEMGRRITIYALLIITLFMVAKIVLAILKKHNIYWALSFIAGVIFVLFVGYYLTADSLAMKRIFVRGLTDPRYGWWLDGLRYAFEYPWGGGEKIIIWGQYTYAHNFWIDIGKSYGILALISLVVFHLLHVKYFYRIFTQPKISNFVRLLFFIIAFVILTYFTIEPVYQSDRSYFFYTLFFVGVVRGYWELYSALNLSTDQNSALS